MLRVSLGNTLMKENIWGKSVLRERLGEQCVRDRLGETVLRERLGVHCAEREIGGTLC